MTALSDKHVAIIGAGGLGGPMGYALAAAGVGTLTLCDFDVVELSNLQRQVQFGTADIGRSKVVALADSLVAAGYSRDRIRLADRAFTIDTADEVASSADIVVDGSDSLATKFLVSDYAVQAGKRFVIAAVERYAGQIVLGPLSAGLGCYRCLFEAPPTDADSASGSCANAGVLGASVAVIAGYASTLTINLARDQPGNDNLFVFDDVRESATPRAIRFQPRTDCRACAGYPRRPNREAP